MLISLIFVIIALLWLLWKGNYRITLLPHLSLLIVFVWQAWHMLKAPALIIDDEKIYLDKGALKSKLVLSLKEIKEIEKFLLNNRMLGFYFELQTGKRITYRFLYEDSLFWENIYTEINRAMNELNEKDDCRA